MVQIKGISFAEYLYLLTMIDGLNNFIAGDILDAYEATIRGEYGQNPPTSTREYTKTALLVFKRSELLYDLKNIAYLEGDVLPTQTEHDRHQIMDIAEDGNIDWVQRIMDLAIAECREIIFAWTKQDVDSAENRDDILRHANEYQIALKVPDDFSKSTLTLLERLIHMFVVYRALAEWLGIVAVANPNAAQKWVIKAQETKDAIESTLNAGSHRARLTQSPF